MALHGACNTIKKYFFNPVITYLHILIMLVCIQLCLVHLAILDIQTKIPMRIY